MHEVNDEFEPAPAVDETDGDLPVRPAIPSTGHPAVDAVLASLAGLEDAPVHEHVAIFESAHDSLRRALDEAGQDPTDQPADQPVDDNRQG